MDMTEEQRAVLKEALKEGLKEWMDEKFTQFGKWSFFTCAAAAMSALGYFVFVVLGTHK